MGRPKRHKPISSEQQISSILSRFNSSRLISQVPAKAPASYIDYDLPYLFPRLERAAMNQIVDGDATVSRYAIWAETVRDLILCASSLFEEGDTDGGKDLIIRVANSLSAFSEIQAYFDPLKSTNKDP